MGLPGLGFLGLGFLSLNLTFTNLFKSAEFKGSLPMFFSKLIICIVNRAANTLFCFC